MQKRLEEGALYCREAYFRGFVGGTGGNASVREGEYFYITPTGSTLSDMRPEQFTKVPVYGRWKPEDGGNMPSKEVDLHQGIYQSRTDINAILHLHPANSIAAVLLMKEDECEVPAYTPGYVAKIGALPIVDFFAPGSLELAQSIKDAFLKHNCALMRNHGLIVGEINMKNCFIKIEEIEANAKLHIILNGRGALGEKEKSALS